MLRRLRRRLIRQLAREAFWMGWEQGAVDATSRLATQICGDQQGDETQVTCVAAGFGRATAGTNPIGAPPGLTYVGGKA